MRYVNFIAAIAALFVATGCGSIRQDQIVRPPASTPFDSNPMRRQAYLEGYNDGYRWVTRREGVTPDFIRGPYRLEREMGWRAGASAASAENVTTEAPAR